MLTSGLAYKSMSLLQISIGTRLVSKRQQRPIHTAQTNSNKQVRWVLSDQCVTPVSVCWHWLGFVFTRVNVQSAFVSVCWGSVNMTIIFHKILNSMANLFVGVCQCGVNWPSERPRVWGLRDGNLTLLSGMPPQYVMWDMCKWKKI